MNLHDLCKKSGFCTPETRAELAKNGFDFSVCAFGVATKFVPFYASSMSVHEKAIEAFGIIAYPTLSEIIEMIMGIEIEHNENTYYFGMYGFSILFSDMSDNPDELFVQYFDNGKTEAACKLWLDLKKGGFLNA